MASHIQAAWKLRKYGFIVKPEKRDNGEYLYLIKQGEKEFYATKVTLVGFAKTIEDKEKKKCDTDTKREGVNTSFNSLTTRYVHPDQMDWRRLFS